MERIDHLRAEVAAVESRLAYLEQEARSVAAGTVEVRRKYDEDETYRGRDEVTKPQPNAAVAYWKEIRETEKRLDDKRAELRALERSGAGEPVSVVVHFDGPEE